MTQQPTTTLKDIRAASPCTEGWEKLLNHLGKSATEAKTDETPLPVLTVFESNGMDDALWVLDCAIGNKHICRLFAADCAEMVLPLFERERPDDTRPRDAISAARDADATSGQRAAAGDAAWAAAGDAAGAAARDAAGDAAGAAARDAAWAAAGDAAWDAARAAARAAAWAAAGAAAGDAAGAAAGAAAWAAARDAAGAAARDAAWAAAGDAAGARLAQYLTHGETAKDMPWPEKLTFNVEGVA